MLDEAEIIVLNDGDDGSIVTTGQVGVPKRWGVGAYLRRSEDGDQVAVVPCFEPLLDLQLLCAVVSVVPDGGARAKILGRCLAQLDTGADEDGVADDISGD